MPFNVETYASDDYAGRAAAYIADKLPSDGWVILTGGGTAGEVYPQLAKQDADWSNLTVAFSDERCVPPDDDESNYGMVRSKLLDHVSPGAVHRIEGEAPPTKAADEYHLTIAGAATTGFDLMMLGMGEDCHICAMFPDSPALSVDTSLAVPVQRPDGMEGITLTPPAVRRAKKIVLVVTGEKKRDAVRKVLAGQGEVPQCPALMLADHPDVTFLLDEAATPLAD